MTQRELTCICCPIGCSIQIKMEAQEIVSIEGNNCLRGETYARREVSSPSRIVTTTVPVSGGLHDVVSVKTKTEIPKEKIMECIRSVRGLKLKAPIHIGDVVLEDAGGTGIALVATSNVEKKAESVIYSA